MTTERPPSGPVTWTTSKESNGDRPPRDAKPDDVWVRSDGAVFVLDDTGRWEYDE